MPAAARVLTARELNRALLARQLLLERTRAGTWKLEGERIRTEPWARPAAWARRELEEEAERLAEFHV